MNPDGRKVVPRPKQLPGVAWGTRNRHLRAAIPRHVCHVPCRVPPPGLEAKKLQEGGLKEAVPFLLSGSFKLQVGWARVPSNGEKRQEF